jgi:predicted nucleotidyltransferase
MDYVRSVEAVIPGVQGRVLGVLARSDAEMTMRTVGKLAAVSSNRAVAVLNQLVSLGLVERREAGMAALVRLARDNEAAKAVLALAGLRETVIAQLRLAAETIDPGPVSLVVFGSFARGEADARSDLDVLAVRPEGIRDDDERWLDSLGRWSDQATRIAGNPVHLLDVGVDEVPRLLTRNGTVWRDIAGHGIVLAGVDVMKLGQVE